MSKEYKLYLRAMVDFDLLCLYSDKNFMFREKCLRVLRAYVNDERLPLIDAQSVKRPETKEHTPQVVTLKICLGNDDLDQNVIDVLESIEPGYRNSFIKTLLRSCLINFDGIYFDKDVIPHRHRKLKDITEERPTDGDLVFEEGRHSINEERLGFKSSGVIGIKEAGKDENASLGTSYSGEIDIQLDERKNSKKTDGKSTFGSAFAGKIMNSVTGR